MQLDDVVEDIQRPGEPARARNVQRQSKEAVEAVQPAPPSQNNDQHRSDLAAANVALRHGEKWLRLKGRGLAVDPQDMPAKLLDRAAAAEVAARGLSPKGRAPWEWRAGDRGRTYSPPGKKRSPVASGDRPQGAEYPSWWGDGDNWRSGGGGAPPSPHRDGGGGRSRSAPRPGLRPPPRLAYTVQAEPGSQAQPLWRNDLVTSRYLDVPSSGYGRAASPPPVPPQYMPPSPQQQQQQQATTPSFGAPHPFAAVGGAAPTAAATAGVSGPFQAPYGMPNPYGNGGAAAPQLYVVQPTGAVTHVNTAAAAWGQPPPSQQQLQHQQAAVQAHQRQQQQQKQQQQRGGKPGWKPIRTSKEATSRIREQVQADRVAARARREARQRAVEATLAPSRPQGGPWSATSASATVTPRSPAGGPSDIADSLAANPFTAWFIGPPPNQQQQQPQGQQQEPQAQQPQQPQELQRPSTPAVQQQQQQSQGWMTETLRMAPAVDVGGTAQPVFPSWANTPQLAPVPQPQPQQPAAAASAAAMTGTMAGPGPMGPASLTFFPQVQNAAGYAGGQGQPARGGSTYPAPAPLPSSPYNPYNVLQYSDAGGPYQTRRGAWTDSPPQQQGGVAPSWLSGPTTWAGPWQQQPQQQQPQPQGQWLMGQQGPWPGAPAVNSSVAAAAPGRGWGDQAGWLGPGAAAGAGTWAPRPQLSPRAEALRVVRPEVVQFSKSWVGDFGHLDGARFPPAAAAGASTAAPEPHQQQRQQQQRGGMPSALATADALLAAAGAGAASREGAQSDAGLYGGDGDGAAGSRQRADPPQAPTARRSLEGQLSGGAAAAQARGVEAALADMREAWLSGGGSGGGGSGGGGGVGCEGAAAGGAAQERAWVGVLKQVSKLGRAAEAEIGSAWMVSEAGHQEAALPVALSGGGVKWDFDKIVGGASGLTYE
ncbi:hypothetical protein PLESTB_001586300 [Pleodorina starrii]|uniref:Uncharacterized protein n=1 Tax=Pleodorina starrii TaxID=330485 RepID=A0A9W6BYJ8_9CHLO|nr:hypothetical protein PLESTB_001586300 [Pleodorina starrii]